MNRSTSSKKKPACKDGQSCSFCGTSQTDELKTGKLHKHGDILAHFFCLLLSSGLSQNGEEEEGILGFLPQDILKELKRGKKLRCARCKKVGATVGCCNKSCRKAFHLPCSLEQNSLHLFFGSFMTYCHEHKPYRKPHGKKNSDISCCICLLPANLTDPYKVLRPSCCKNGFFHKQCIQRQAITAGYFFKCPLCNNTDEFKKEMLDSGIYIPEQDAAWELEQNAFHDLYERHSNCDAETCLCPRGRDYDMDDCPWEVVLCTVCGSEGSHIACGRISTVTRDWQCPNCATILNKIKEKRLIESGDVIVIESSDSDTGGSSPRLQLSSSDNSFLCETPENCQPPRLRTPPRVTRKRFAQLNEYKYNLSPNHEPALKDDICSSVRTSPRTTKNIYSRRQRVCSLRELMRRKKQKKMESKSSTSNSASISNSPEIINYINCGEKEKFPGGDHDENKPSTSRGNTDKNYSRPFTRAKLKNENSEVKEMAQRYQNNMIKVEKLLLSSTPTKDVKMTSILNYFPNQHDSNKRISSPSPSKGPRKKMKKRSPSDGTSDIRNYFK